MLFGPGGTAIGALVGGRIAAVAGRAAAAALATHMMEANESAEEQTKDEAQARPCIDCGEIGCFKPPEDAKPEDIDELQRQLRHLSK